MDRRDTIKTLIGTALGTALLTQATGCKEEGAIVPESATEAKPKGYGLRTAYEAERDERLLNDRFFTDHELACLAVLGDIIVPNIEESNWLEFADFICLDLPDYHQTRMRGGLAWLNAESSRRFAGLPFDEITPEQRLEIVDEIAYPDPEAAVQDPGVRFFSHARYLAVTCWFTSKAGIEDLGYVGNQPNVWDGPPPEVLAQYNVDYEPQWKDQYVDQEKRSVRAEWDDDMNLIS